MNNLRDRSVSIRPDDVPELARHRVHEAEGMGRRAFALFQCLRHPGQVMWVMPAHAPQRPMLRGLPAGLTERLLLVTPKGEADLLWCVEEALRAAPVSLVIAEPQQPLSLTAGRRLQLAAEAGRTGGLMLIQDGQGSNAAETRWRCDPLASPETDSTLHLWSLNKNKRGTIGSWVVNWNGASAAFRLVPPAGKRHQPEGPSR